MRDQLKLSMELKAILASDDLNTFMQAKVKRGGVYGKEKKTILHLAAKYCQSIAIPYYCVYKLKVNPKTKTKRSNSSALHYACIYGKLQLVEFLVSSCKVPVDIQRKHGETPLLLAIRHNHNELSEFLISKNADLNVKDSKDWTLAHWAAKNGNSGLLSKLIKLGAPFQGVTKSSEYCLHFAASSGNADIVKALFPYFYPFACGEKGTVLHYAKGNWEIVEWVISNTIWQKMPRLSILLDIGASSSLIFQYCKEEINLGVVLMYDRADLLEILYINKKIQIQLLVHEKLGPRCTEKIKKLERWENVRGLLFVYKHQNMYAKVPLSLTREISEYI
ncbi:unnamed protein product [Blepharisma stoltei]|uniref:Ankyrin repeat protein n=1 Tax=Blepharisma stoltei TaxID=1481888 RepID=A0AAU9IRY4_9CILI|nr:unnamed protein product [Blepharisma stoltei]